MTLAKAVANAAAMLVLKAKNVAQVAEDTVLQNRVIAAATRCALSTSQLVACTKVPGSGTTSHPPLPTGGPPPPPPPPHHHSRGGGGGQEGGYEYGNMCRTTAVDQPCEGNADVTTHT